MPSWYALFLALAGLAAAFRFLDSRRARWLVAAGAASGAACAIKITGLYVIAALLLWMIWLVQEETPSDATRTGVRRTYAWFVTAGLLAYLALVGRLVVGVGTPNAVLHFAVPSIALAGLLLAREWRRPADAGAARLRRFASLAAPFAAGLAAVVVAWIAPYALTGSLESLVHGLFVTPQVRFDVAAYPLPGLRSAGLSVLPFAVLIAGAPFVRRPLRAADRWALALVFGALAAVTVDGSPTVLLVWYGFRLLAPCTVVLGAWWLASADPRIAIVPRRRSLVFLLLAATATGSLIQVPFALYTYFLYFVPFLLLALAAVMTSQPLMPREVPAVLLAFILWFGFRQPDSRAASPAPKPDDRPALLALPRGGLLVTRDDSTVYADLYAAVHARRPGAWIYVWHDAPEVYFLMDARNPTQTLFNTFDDSLARDPAHVEAELVGHDVRVAVLTPPGGVTVPMAPALRAWIERTYPHREQVHRFEVRWRDGADTIPAVSRH